MIRLFFFLIAFVLALTAGLKGWVLATDEFADIKTGVSKSLLAVTIAFELFVAFCNIAKRPNRALWLLNISLILAFVAFSLNSVYLGKQNCGCAGFLEIPPSYTLAFNVLLLVILLSLFSRLPNELSDKSSQLLLGRYAAFALVAGIVWLADIPSLTHKGFPPVQFELKNAVAGEATVQLVPIENRFSQNMQIIGYRKSCGCFSIPASFQTAGPGGTMEVPIQVTPQKPGWFHQRVVFYLDSSFGSTIAVDIFGDVLERKELE